MDKYNISCYVAKCLDDRRALVTIADVQRFIRKHEEITLSADEIEEVLNDLVTCGWLMFEGNPNNMRWLRYISPEDKRKLFGRNGKKHGR
jgi:hypothetical protein